MKIEKHFTHKTLSSTEKRRSFTWRVPAANIRVMIHYSSKCPSNDSLFWDTEDDTASKISSKLKLQTKAVKKPEKKEFSCLYIKNINLKIPCINPDSNVEIDRV